MSVEEKERRGETLLSVTEDGAIRSSLTGFHNRSLKGGQERPRNIRLPAAYASRRMFREHSEGMRRYEAEMIACDRTRWLF